MHAQVISTQRLTPSLVRVVLGGDGLRDFAMPATTDAYVNLAFPAAGAPYAAPFDPAEVRETHPGSSGRPGVATRSARGTRRPES